MTVRRVTTIGSAMVDTIAVIDDDLIERMSMNNAGKSFLLLEGGRKTEAKLISTHAGGGAVNAAVAFARLGFHVSAMVKCGQDDRAQTIREALMREGVSCERMTSTTGAATGASVLIAAHDRNATIFTFRGANGFLDRRDVANVPVDGDILYIASLSERSADHFPDIVARTANDTRFIAANPGIRQLSAGGDAFHRALGSLSLLSMNVSEATALIPRLLDRRAKPRRALRPASSHPTQAVALTPLMQSGFSIEGRTLSLAHFMEAALEAGPRCVLVTDGARGAYAGMGDRIYHCPPLNVAVVGTAGAGDAFSSTFAASLAEGEPPDRALQLAAINASSVVRHADTQSGLLRRNEIEALFIRHHSALAVQSWTLA